MKKCGLMLAIFLVIAMVLAGCDPSTEAQPTEYEVVYLKGVYEDLFGEKKWTVPAEGITGGQEDAVPDKEAAIAIACAELEKLQEKGDAYKDHVVGIVYFDTADAVWVVTCSHKDKNTVGGGLSMAISKKTGEILNTWTGE